jgi:hypothetical protein
MNGGILAFLMAGVISMAAGLFMYFDGGNTAGVVFIAVGAMFFALGGMKAGKDKKGNGDAG